LNVQPKPITAANASTTTTPPARPVATNAAPITTIAITIEVRRL
jgi:hypothetical protein